MIDRFGQSAGETSIIGLCNPRLLSYSTNERMIVSTVSVRVV